MLFVLFALWIIALGLVMVDPRSSTMRWMSAIAFTGGFGALAAVLSETFIPYIQQTVPNPSISTLLYRIMGICSLISYYGLPYSFAMLALKYNAAWQKPAIRTWLPIGMLLPPIACLLFTPGYTEEMPITFPIVALWAVPYIFSGAVLIVMKMDRLPAMRRTHLFTCLALLPPILCVGVLNYVMPSFGFYRMWVYHVWILAFVVPFFVFTFFKYGFLGMRLLIERRKLDSTLRAITSGTAILNHAIKNDVGKMRLFLEKMKQHAEDTNQTELIQDIEVVMGASQHIRDMISRVHEQTQELPLRVSAVHLGDLLEEVLLPLRPYLAKIAVHSNISEESTLQLDRIQIAETLTNVLMNAIEAMPQGGELIIRTLQAKKNIVLEIKDNGLGMEKEVLKQVLEPFYTTKSGSHSNFGLGLAYCYSVMKKHGGSLELSSSPGKGTSVFLTFPGSRLQT
ncbi:sensor histidine kinase [Paenibacillus aceris]|uniref:histidine kinase n=1 Tax=Paenibacillus aceris TaxID=869555 RepID=A0ABS4HV86_9BACL|nr:HAMP domain-containing sensor histidine kinase [Paenibacillus aceris]MBP1962136.1 signal transduction histidine kinase [Paenibacillus aceris]NHW34015.1 HAMP domain-containing histidine kinase [Paenibacillus aceris]